MRPSAGTCAAGPLAAVLALAMTRAVQAAQEAVHPIGIMPPELSDPTLRVVGIPQIVLLVLLAAAVFYVLDWVFLDVRFVGTNQPLWSGAVLAGGMAGVLAAVFMPLFFIGLPLGILLFGGAAIAYARHRNGLVSPRLTVLSKAHLERIAGRLKGRSVTEQVGPVTGVGRDIIFMGLDDLPIRLEAASPLQAMANQEVERVLFEAITRGASVAGLLVRGPKAQVRLRIDGEVAEADSVEAPASEHFAGGLKRLAGLDPAETRKPQEGRFRAVVAGQAFDMRVKTSGSVRGEQITVRLLDLTSGQRHLEDLNLSEDQAATFTEALAQQPGLVVVSAPKDSGLTTTLHACLRGYDRYMNTCVIFEPHVDLEVENVQHIALNQEGGAAAAEAVQSQLRTGPDVVAIDSLSSPEVARLLAAAAAEIRVLVGLRAADAGQALGRIAQLFGAAAPLAKSLFLVTNQRLVRMLCPDCKEAYRPNPDFLRKANLTSAKVDVLYRARTHIEMEKGQPVVCPRCRNVRYAGRMGLFELMPIDQEARALLEKGAQVSDVRGHARKLGMRNLQEEGLRLVIDGRTSIEEVLRAIKQAK